MRQENRMNMKKIAEEIYHRQISSAEKIKLLNYLVVSDINSSSTKIQKAEALNVSVITKTELEKML